MRLIKMLGLAVVAAIAAMAVVGASTASAGNTKLCTDDPCATAATSVHSIDPLAVLKTTFPKKEILCQALFSGTPLALGAPQIVHGSFTFTLPHSTTGECYEMIGEEHCKVTDINGGLLKVLRTGPELAEVTGEGFNVSVKCSGLECEYEAKGLVGHGLGPLLAEGGTTGKISIIAQEAEKLSGFLCPSTSLLTTTQVNLAAVYIGE